MGENSTIEWTHHTFNPWMGCTKVSPGCAHCYAERDMDHRYGKVKWGKGSPRLRTSPANWAKPLAWDRACAKAGRRDRVFCASLADWLDDEVPIEWLRDLLELISRTPHLDWLLLTKRPQNWLHRLHGALEFGSKDENCLTDMFLVAWIDGRQPANVWVGTTVEDQQRADERIPALLAIPALVRFLSCEPLLGPVDLRLDWRNDIMRVDSVGRAMPLRRVDWIIAGGESGPEARPMHPDWARSLRDQAAAAGVPFLFKQWGEWAPLHGTGRPLPDDEEDAGPWTWLGVSGKTGQSGGDEGDRDRVMVRYGKHTTGRHLDSELHDAVPSPA